MTIQEEFQAIYKPSDWGREYHAATYDEVLGGGAAGPGKTEVLIAEPFQQVVVEHERMVEKRHPHRISPGQSKATCLFLRRTFTMLDETIDRASRLVKAVDPKAHWNGVTHTFTFSSGLKYKFGHCKDPSDWMLYQGSQFTMLLIDELTQMLKEQYLQLIARVRSTDPVLSKMLKIRCMSNPNMDREGMEGVKVDDDPYWVRKRFVDRWPAGRKKLTERIKLSSGKEWVMTRAFIPAQLSDNPDPDFRDRYEARLRQLPTHIQAALLKGDWYVSVGAFFSDDWQKDIHIVRPFKIPKDWLRFRSMDWGFKLPGCVHWWAMDPDGNLYCEYEFYFKGMTATEVAKRIKEREEQYGLWNGRNSRLTGPADTQLWEKRGSSAMSMGDEMARVGVRWVKADKLSRSRNAKLLASRLRDHGNGTKQPGIVFFENCKKAIQTIPALQAMPGDPEQPQDGGEDHAFDSVAYACAYASRGRAGISMQRSEVEQDRIDEDSDRGRYGYGEAY